MLNKRLAAGMPEKMTDEEITEAWKLMDEAFATWTVIEKQMMMNSESRQR